ncbi:ABC transporter permease [Occallatibacter savannae]|uniref:ABC transporter permease n=1 Tax=Occallatibacter savannae TaxID=1002691 RepID=UPI000D6881B8|nr:ABC transporter permease subunit [Occallatibacter savannae]
MSVFQHEYRPYEGPTTPLWKRPVVLARYGLAEAWGSKITIGLAVLALLPCLVELVLMYLADNPLAKMLVVGNSKVLEINERFFFNLLEVQSWFALVLAAWIAPRLVSFDLGDNAMPILLSHPISRFGYVLGKFIALVLSLSYVTWIPLLLLFVYQCYASPVPWAVGHLGVAFGLFTGALVWIVVLSLVCLAVSSWVKWRVVATGAIFAVVFVPAGVGGMVSAILRTRWGFLLNVPVVMSELWMRLLGVPPFGNPMFWFPNIAIVSVLVVTSLLCVAVLNARIRAREVVRG